ncbi:hypothetical protein HJC23_011563 [Cyclotella cryptica]|uniref:C3H1-type domain-containing protein n=1 Tax=Cyclotella cryptica TaxID=29204 RepID=A0ABD3P0K6_9STRA|eukprot:CCRYP_018438-RA/>CCRYP_018438-RA protein AED:0.38 eAED:0.38 QI:0/-1/0/1/-1/1/1/0/248
MDVKEEDTKKRKAEATPPDGYVCRLCSVPGHWIQVCPTKKTGSKRKKSDHVPVPGKDPSPEDIEEVRELQKIPPPKCFCGLPSRLNKVKQSKEGGEKSRAIGKYFFFCSKKKSDDTQCRFARPVEMEINKMKAKEGAIKAAKERLKELKPQKKNEVQKPKQVCKFFAKNGICKKGKKCEFSHDLQSKKATIPPSGKSSLNKKAQDEENGKVSSSDGSSENNDEDDSNNSSSNSDTSDENSSDDDSGTG